MHEQQSPTRLFVHWLSFSLVRTRVIVRRLWSSMNTTYVYHFSKQMRTLLRSSNFCFTVYSLAPNSAYESVIVPLSCSLLSPALSLQQLCNCSSLSDKVCRVIWTIVSKHLRRSGSFFLVRTGGSCTASELICSSSHTYLRNSQSWCAALKMRLYL